ncbi:MULTISPECIES: hypothetical protein [Pseudomonas syringae group]|uniref:Uncharacterized protein n=1 Tax=Pseudomonas syringae pv. japonica str. M301072 TaxID=629262 RepID=F3FHA1_PSESX|nr:MULTISPECIES: hypothetical protein [Pseudomonas syringae group]EGH29587.1 hypothetical protein PSYJA_11635 [Pseudomonas syringae pv. japonica str. M301072]
MKSKEHREAYSYPFVGLTGTVGQHSHIEFNTSSELDAYHHQLLRSTQNEQSVLGYLSVLYWGHYATSKGATNRNRALSKVQGAIKGSSFVRKGVNSRRRGLVDLPHDQAVRLIREAITLVDSARYGEAISVLCALPQLKFAFASKIVAFLSPSTCGVIDSVIAKKNPEFGFKMSGKYVSTASENFQHYEKYCALLFAKAEALNDLGASARWVDRDGRSYPWRALDVERAFYGE